MAHKNKKNYSAYKARQLEKGLNKVSKGSAKDNSPAPPNEAKNIALRRSPLLGKHKKPEHIFSVEEANDRLYDLFRNHEMSHIGHEQRKSLAQYYVLLMEQQKVLNFTRLINLKDVAIKHFIDSLLVNDLVQLAFPLLDLGSGPGLPGIPLKIVNPEQTILLAEGAQKRVEFLKKVRAELALKKLLILGKNIDAEFLYPCQGVITRAVEDIPNTLGNVINCLQTGGRVFFMKGPNYSAELDLFNNSQVANYYEMESVKEYQIPNTPHDRSLLVFRKVKSPILSEDFFESLGLQYE